MSDRRGAVIVVVGPPNAGKGTQVKILADHLGAMHFSVGDLIRAHNDPTIMEEHDQGKLAPSDYIRELIVKAISDVPLEQPIVFDGAKKLAEAQWLVEFLPTIGRHLEHVVSLVLDEAESRRRSAQRASGRPDDAPEVQNERWVRYHADVAPAISFYRDKGLLIEIDASVSVEAVSQQIWLALGL